VIVAASGSVTVIGTLAGAIVGTIGTGLTAFVLETRRWKREDPTRWHSDRREAYVRFLRAADDYSVAGRTSRKQYSCSASKGLPRRGALPPPGSCKSRASSVSLPDETPELNLRNGLQRRLGTL
jgi:hypothetical protein